MSQTTQKTVDNSDAPHTVQTIALTRSVHHACHDLGLLLGERYLILSTNLFMQP